MEEESWAPFRTAAEAIRDDVVVLSRAIHGQPETAFREVAAQRLLTTWLQRRGFTIEAPVAGLDTAFAARSGEGHPHVALLAEYDALPGLGHACGHNLISAGAAGAAAILRSVLPSSRGRMSVIGTPGEEGGGGKVLELDAGLFRDVDAVLMFHPADRTLAWRRATSSVHLRIEFRGRAAHAAKNPEEGRNALAAMIQFFVATDGLRQHIPERARLHGVIRNGGAAPNIVPDYTEAEFLVRDATREGALALSDRVADCARGAALATGTEVEVAHSAPTYSERKNNHVIAGRLASYLDDLGVAQEAPSDAHPAGSSDIGNVSLTVPTIHPYLQIADRGVMNHTDAFREAAATPRAHAATMQMALALARTAFDLLTEDGLLAAAWAEFEAHDREPAETPVSVDGCGT